MALIHHHRLDGNGLDSINGNHLSTFVHSPTIPLSGGQYSFMSAKIGQGANRSYNETTGTFNANYRLRSATPIALEDSFSYAAWINADPVNMGHLVGVVNVYNHTTPSAGATLYIDNSGRATMAFGLGDTRPSYNVSGNLLGRWTHLVLTYDRNVKQGKLYIDGVLGRTVSNIDPKTGNFFIDVGAWSNAYMDYGGPSTIDDVRIYDHALSDREVRDLSLGIVTHLKMTDFTDSTNNSIDIQSNNAVLHDEPPRPCVINDAGVTNRHLIIKDAPAVTHDQSISLWLYPTSNEKRRNPWNRAYGGEGTIVHEPTGKLAYYWGTYGEDGSPYYARTTSSTLPLNEWTHVVVVRDVTNQQIHWYINGKLDSSWSGTIGTIPESKSDVLIGTGYTSPYLGRIGEVRQYATALTESQIKELYHQIASIDSIGTLHTSYIHETGIRQSIKNCNWTTWQVGQEGSVGDFAANGGASQSYKSSRILALNPWGKEAVVWKGIGNYTGASSSDADGGFIVNAKPVDPTKMYRLSVWMKRSVTGNGSTYFGARATPSVLKKSSGAVNSNPYFLSSNNSAEENKSNEWHLWVGHIWPAGSSTGATYAESGVYNLSGTKIREISDDFIWAEGTTSGNLRAFLYYVTDETTEELFCYPRMDICDGTEPQLSELLSGFDSANESLFRLYDGEIPPIKFNTKLIGNFNEVDENGDPISTVAIDGLTMNIKQINEV